MASAAILFLSCIAIFRGFADAQITAWTETGYTVTAGTSTKIITASLTAKVPENKSPGDTLFTVAATKTGSANAIAYTITSGNTGSVAEVDANGAVKLATGKSLDYETTPSYVFVITAVEAGQTAAAATGTATLTVSIKNVLEFGQKQYGVCMSNGATADTTVGTYTVSDNTASTTVTYAIGSGNTNSDFTITSAGLVKVATGKTLAQATTGGYMLGLTATESGSASDMGAATVWIAVGTCSSSAVHVAAMVGVTVLSLAVSVFA